MASKAEVEGSLEDLEKEITCAICREWYTDPRVLPCCHYYCKECIYKLALRTGLSKPFSCPECRVDTLLPQSTVKSLPIAFFVNRMKDLYSKLKQAQNKVESKCGVCSTGLKVSAYCQDCAQFICDECIKSHQRIKIYLNHVVSILDGLTENEACKVLTQQESPVQVCSDHGQPMGLYCFDCDCLICRDCTIKDHFGHNYEFIKKAALAAKENLFHQLSPLQSLVACLSKATTGIETEQSELQDHGNFLSGEIKNSFRELHEILEKREGELLGEVSIQIHQKLERLASQEKNIAQSKLVLLGVIDYTEHCLKHCTDNEIMNMQSEVEERIVRAREEHFQLDTKLEPVEEMNIKVEVFLAQDLKLLCQTKATTRLLSVDPSKCTISGSGFRFAEVGKLAEFNVVTKLCNGQYTKQASTVSCFLKSLTNGSSVECKIDRPKLGEYLIQYLPTIRGHNSLTVKVNGQEIAKSPMYVCAYIPPTQLNQPVSVINKVSTPHGIAVNSSGEVIVTEWSGDILTFDKTGRKLMQKCIKRSQYKFDRLAGVDVDKSDNVYIVDKSNFIFKFSKKMDLIKKVKHVSSSSNLSGIVVSQDKVVVCDKNINSMAVYDTDLVYIKQVNSHNIGSRETGIFDLSVDYCGNFYLSHCGNQHVQVISSDGELLRFFGTEDGDRFQPRGIFVAGQFVYVANEINHKLCVYSLEGEFVASIGKWGSGKCDFYSPVGVCVRESYVYICDRFNNRVQIF